MRSLAAAVLTALVALLTLAAVALTAGPTDTGRRPAPAPNAAPTEPR